MNVRAIRTDMAAALSAAGYTGLPAVPDTVPDFPAAIVAPPRAIDFGETLTQASLLIPVTIAVSASDIDDAQRRLDLAVSTGNPESVVDVLNGTASANWTSIRVDSIEGYRSVTDGAQRAMALDLIVKVFSRK